MSYQLKVIKDYPIGFWPLDESSGTTATDVSGCGNNGTYNGTPFSNILPIIPGGSCGTKITDSTYITFPLDKNFYGVSTSNGLANKYSSDNDFTIEAWFHQSATTLNELPILADITNNIGLYYQNGDVVFKVSDSEYIRWAVEDHNQAMHIVGVYMVGLIRLYINGEEVASKILDSFKFNNTSFLLQSGPTSSGDSFILDAPAVYRYSLSSDSILQHFVSGSISCQPLHVAYPEEGTLFTCTDSRFKIRYDYYFGVNNNWADLVDDNTYYDDGNGYITFKPSSISESKEFIIEKDFLIPTEIGLITSKVEWKNKFGIRVYSKSQESDPWVECINNQPLPQYSKDEFSSSARVYIKVVMSTTDVSKYIPRLSYLGIKFYSETTVYADNYGDQITSNTDYYLGSLNYPTLSRIETNGIRSKNNAGFNLIKVNPTKTIELFFTPKSLSATTMFYDPTTGAKYAWNGSGTVSKASISKVYINGVDKTSQTNISNFMTINQPHHVVLVLTQDITGTSNFNYETSGGGPSNLYNNITLYPRELTNTEILQHFNLYVGKPATSIAESVITLTESDPKYYNIDYTVVNFV